MQISSNSNKNLIEKNFYNKKIQENTLSSVGRLKSFAIVFFSTLLVIPLIINFSYIKREWKKFLTGKEKKYLDKIVQKSQEILIAPCFSPLIKKEELIEEKSTNKNLSTKENELNNDEENILELKIEISPVKILETKNTESEIKKKRETPPEIKEKIESLLKRFHMNKDFWKLFNNISLQDLSIEEIVQELAKEIESQSIFHPLDWWMDVVSEDEKIESGGFHEFPEFAQISNDPTLSQNTRLVFRELITFWVNQKKIDWIFSVLNKNAFNKETCPLPEWYIDLLLKRYETIKKVSYLPLPNSMNLSLLGLLTKNIKSDTDRLKIIFSGNDLGILTKKRYRELRKLIVQSNLQPGAVSKRQINQEGAFLLNKLILAARTTNWGIKEMTRGKLMFVLPHVSMDQINSHNIAGLLMLPGIDNLVNSIEKSKNLKKNIKEKIISAFEAIRRTDEYYVFVHGLNKENAFFSDLLEAFCDEKLKGKKVMRLLFEDDRSFPSLLEERQTDNSMGGALISADANIHNIENSESAWDFFLRNRSINNPGTRLLTIISKKLDLNTAQSKLFVEKISSVWPKFPKNDKGEYGRMRLFLIPKKRLTDEDKNYIFSSHPYGELCGCESIDQIDHTIKAIPNSRWISTNTSSISQDLIASEKKQNRKKNKASPTLKSTKTQQLESEIIEMNKNYEKNIDKYAKEKNLESEKEINKKFFFIQNEDHQQFLRKLEKSQASQVPSHTQYRINAKEFENDDEKIILDFQENPLELDDKIKKGLKSIIGCIKRIREAKGNNEIINEILKQFPNGLIINEFLTKFPKELKEKDEIINEILTKFREIKGNDEIINEFLTKFPELKEKDKMINEILTKFREI